MLKVVHACSVAPKRRLSNAASKHPLISRASRSLITTEPGYLYVQSVCQVSHTSYPIQQFYCGGRIGIPTDESSGKGVHSSIPLRRGTGGRQLYSLKDKFILELLEDPPYWSRLLLPRLKMRCTMPGLLKMRRTILGIAKVERVLWPAGGVASDSSASGKGTLSETQT